MRLTKRCPTCGSLLLCVWGEWKHFDEATQRWADAENGCPLSVIETQSVSADVYHVMPYRDVIEHHTTDECPCGPTLNPVKRDDGSIGWSYTHHSLDGREKCE